jgi:hypothetical protein
VAYYYLIAQLSSLSYGQPAPMTSAAFKKLAWDGLDPGDRELLDFCTLNPWSEITAGKMPPEEALKLAASSEFIRSWRDWDRALRLNLARYRAPGIKREGPADVPEYPADAADAAKAAAALDSPLEAELFLDEARWRAVEGFQGIAYFHVNTVYAYLLKLLLMERRSLFRAEEGFAEYKGLYAAVMETAGSGGLFQAGTPSSNESGEPK